MMKMFSSFSQISSASCMDSQAKQLMKPASGIVVSTTFLRLGNPPFGKDSKVLRPIITACPVVRSLKRFMSAGMCQSRPRFFPIALLSEIAATIEIVLIAIYDLLFIIYDL